MGTSSWTVEVTAVARGLFKHPDRTAVVDRETVDRDTLDRDTVDRGTVDRGTEETTTERLNARPETTRREPVTPVSPAPEEDKTSPVLPTKPEKIVQPAHTSLMAVLGLVVGLA